MTLKLRFTLFVVLLHVLLIVAAVYLLIEDKVYFFIAEGVIIISLGISVHLYRAFLKPLDLISAGVESIRDKDFATKFLPTGQRELDRLIDVYNRMIDQLRSERIRQREQHYFLERLMHAIPVGVLILDLDNLVSMVNPAGEVLLGVRSEDILGGALRQLPGPLGRHLGNLTPGETLVVAANGTQTFRCRMSQFLDRGFQRHFVLIEELTHEILASQKRAYENVIRMMSHEVNNTIGAVNSIMQTGRGFGEQLKHEDYVEFDQALSVAINRNNGLNRFMSNLASVVRIPAPVFEEYDLHELLRSVQVLMSGECSRRNITWEWRLDDGPMMLSMDVHQMEQVLMNIVKNAVESIDHDGTITVSTKIDSKRLLTITDTGRGISDKDREHLFTPFYSTKRDGQGIGLTLIREILINHDCTFGLEPGEEIGAHFWISFPEK